MRTVIEPLLSIRYPEIHNVIGLEIRGTRGRRSETGSWISGNSFGGYPDIHGSVICGSVEI